VTFSGVKVIEKDFLKAMRAPLRLDIYPIAINLRGSYKL
jgi:hypothetical protein